MENVTQAVQTDQERALRPKTFAEFLGQETSKRSLQVYVRGALSRGEPLDHVLLAGPPGLGKTTLAGILAAEMGARLVVVNAPSVKTKGELASLLTSLRRGDILFLDEIHSLNAKIEEVLYPAMEDLRLEVVAGNRALTIRLEPFTLIGATTRAGMLQRPLRDRFGVTVEMQPYTVEELSRIAMESSRKLGVPCDADGAAEVARRSRGTPRVANRILRRVRDFAHAAGHRTANRDIVAYTCDQLGIDRAGLDKASRRYLQILAERGVPTALKTLTALLGESQDVVEEVVEPGLMRLGFVEVTPRGRTATPAGLAHLGAGN